MEPTLMGFTEQQLVDAKAAQARAAHDEAPQVRLIAGPGTGKSYSMGERVKHLLGLGVQPSSIAAVSFTNEATDDLRRGIQRYCTGSPGIDDVRITTLHSLGLSILANGHRLTRYPARPRVLDRWEEANVLVPELMRLLHVRKDRCEELRTYWEAHWTTNGPPPEYMKNAPKTPVTSAEELAFKIAYRRVSEMYAFILPGESNRLCVDEAEAGLLDLLALSGVQHLIADEYQDFNPVDVRFIDLFAERGAKILVCGDDDQSIYSFRYAYPDGIQTFLTRHADAADHALSVCFRSASSIHSAASSTITSFPAPNRIGKASRSAYELSSPPVVGQTIGWHFADASAEAATIARSVRLLLEKDVKAEDIMILVANRKALQGPIEAALREAGIPVNSPEEVELASSDGVRFVYCVLRASNGGDDFLALRTLLSLLAGVGERMWGSISDKCQLNGLNFGNQFGPSRATGLFDTREIRVLDRVASLLAAAQSWELSDTLGDRHEEISAAITPHISGKATQAWIELVSELPAGMTLDELLQLLQVRSYRRTLEFLTGVYARLGLTLPDYFNPVGRVRLMTLHSSKGLTAKIVFIPGLEEEVLPGSYRLRFPHQVAEAARLLYVGLTRAQALCVTSYADWRMMNGRSANHQPSRFLTGLGIAFGAAPTALSVSQLDQALRDISNL
jgi:DNA helicase-2/ATP-dependent DNA helicase PcrA